jgi:hypothetical protein
MLGAFRGTARMVSRPDEAIQAVIDEATKRDYAHLRLVLAQVVDD